MSAARRNAVIHAQFSAWLRGAVGRPDAVGDFARFWLRDVAAGCAAEIRTLSGIDSHLNDHQRCDLVRGRDLAWREFDQRG